MSEYVCPHCKNSIYDEEALFCHFCGESLRRPSHGFLGRMKYAPAKISILIFILLLIVSFFLLMAR